MKIKNIAAALLIAVALSSCALLDANYESDHMQKQLIGELQDKYGKGGTINSGNANELLPVFMTNRDTMCGRAASDVYFQYECTTWQAAVVQALLQGGHEAEALDTYLASSQLSRPRNLDKKIDQPWDCKDPWKQQIAASLYPAFSTEYLMPAQVILAGLKARHDPRAVNYVLDAKLCGPGGPVSASELDLSEVISDYQALGRAERAQEADAFWHKIVGPIHDSVTGIYTGSLVDSNGNLNWKKATDNDAKTTALMENARAAARKMGFSPVYLYYLDLLAQNSRKQMESSAKYQ